jgi:uncharacterized protein YbjT (DUF2867 family)
MPDQLSVLLTGATGCAGSGVLKACLNHPNVGKVSVLTRKSIGIEHEKLRELIHQDFLDYSGIKEELAGHDACFWCLGVSQSKVRDSVEYRRITYDFTMEAAKVLDKVNPGMTFCFLTGMGTDETEKSRFMWARIKGKAEKDLGNYNFRLYNFRPGFIHPTKGGWGGVGEKRCSRLGSLLYPFIKNSRKYCVEADDFGRAMINAALFSPENHTLENTDIRELAKRTE